MSGRRAMIALLCAGAGSLAAALAGGCSQEPAETPLRALQSSGPVSFLCLGEPGPSAESVALPLSECDATRASSPSDFAVPHLYTMVTQPTTGEVAVIDLTTSKDAIIDDDPSVPGSNFLSVGAAPTDIVSTPGGMATFVAAAEPRYEAIYALPSNMIRGARTRLSSWPACRLPSAPGELTVVVDPADANGALRPSCDAAYGDSDPTSECEGSVHCHGDLSVDAASVGNPGRYKLVVTLPSEGGIAVIDAQSILDQDGGAHEPCVIERWLPLEVILPPPPEPTDPPAPANGACVPDTPVDGPFAGGYTPQPAGLEHDGARLYIADRSAPVIHRVDLFTPCDPTEIPPLVPTSSEAPDRVVTTSRIAVSPLTLDLKRYLYAIDDADGSIMVFDVSDGATETQPLERPHPENNPFQPSDRIRFNAPPREIIIVQHQTDATDTTTGVTLPVRCDPDPDSTGPGTRYQTGENLESGAGPTKLRGVFAFALLSTGDIVTIDVDDYDAACRGPNNQSALFGCEGELASGLKTSGEYSCNTVAPHQPRSAPYLVGRPGELAFQPGLVNFPSLFDDEGTLVQLDDEDAADAPRMRATLPAVASDPFNLVVGTTLHEMNAGTGLTEGDEEHTLQMNLVDPRAHILNQGWSVTYEGALPGFGARFATLSRQGLYELGMLETSSRFCARGVLSQTAVEEELVEGGTDTDRARKVGRGRADYVQMLSSTPVAGDPYWDAATTSCTYQICQQTFGARDQPRRTRDLRILEAWDDHLELEPRIADDRTTAPEMLDVNHPEIKPKGQIETEIRQTLDAMECCFPGVVEFRIRGGNQWIVQGDQVGFLNNVAVRDDGVCRKSCDPELELLNGRALTAPTKEPLPDGDPYAFKNPFFRFAILNGKSPRDMAFRFQTQGAFSPLVLSVVTDNPDVLPTSASFLPNTGKIVISDGVLDGITLLDLNSLTLTGQYR